MLLGVTAILLLSALICVILSLVKQSIQYCAVAVLLIVVALLVQLAPVIPKR